MNVQCAGKQFREGFRVGCGWSGRRASVAGPCPRCHGDVREATDLRAVREWLQSGGIFRDSPLEDVHCTICSRGGGESGGCIMYPDPTPELDEGHAPQQHRPSTICPRCSTPAAERWLRANAERQGYELRPVSVFGVHA